MAKDNNLFELNLVDNGNSHALNIEYKAIVICNDNNKVKLLRGDNRMDFLEPYIILTNNDYPNDRIDTLKYIDLNKTIVDALKGEDKDV